MNLKVVVIDSDQQRSAVLLSKIKISKLCNTGVSFSGNQQALFHITKKVNPDDNFLVFLNFESDTLAYFDFLRAVRHPAFYANVLVIILYSSPATIAERFRSERQVLSVIQSPVLVEDINLCGIKALNRILSAEGAAFQPVCVAV